MDAERGFTLIEVMLAAALFAFVGVTGFELLRQLQGALAVVTQRADAAAQLATTEGELRSAALSAVAVFKPPSNCGDAVEFLKRNAGGTTFSLYTTRATASGTALIRSDGPGPLDPCDATLSVDSLIVPVNSLTVTVLKASDLPAHTDPIGGAADGGLFVASGITAVEVDSTALSFDGSAIPTGNDVVEVRIDADPRVDLIDLMAGNRPSACTQQLSYPCNGRCEANTPFPELRGGTFTDCQASIGFANSPQYYAPATYALQNAGQGQQRIVIASYYITASYLFAFSGPAPLTLARDWAVAVWPPVGSPLAGTIADSYPLDYAENAVAARGAAQLALDLGEPAAFAAELSACSDLDAESGKLFE